MGSRIYDLPKSGLSIATNATARPVDTTLLSKWSRRSALLTTLLLNGLLLRRSHTLRRLSVPIALLRELVLLVGVVLECHFN